LFLDWDSEEEHLEISNALINNEEDSNLPIALTIIRETITIKGTNPDSILEEEPTPNTTPPMPLKA